MHTYIQADTYSETGIYTFMCIHTDHQDGMLTYVHTEVYIYIHTYRETSTHSPTHTHIHIYMHTETCI